MKAQIEKELKRTNCLHGEIANIGIIGDTELIDFTMAGRAYWARLTPTGKLKKNSIRIDNF